MDQPQSPLSIVNALSIIIVGAYVAAMPLWMFYPPTKVPPEILAIINQMMGAWGMAFGTVIAFHLGSSRSAKDAGEANRSALATMTATTAAAAAPLPVATPAVAPEVYRGYNLAQGAAGVAVARPDGTPLATFAPPEAARAAVDALALPERRAPADSAADAPARPSPGVG